MVDQYDDAFKYECASYENGRRVWKRTQSSRGKYASINASGWTDGVMEFDPMKQAREAAERVRQSQLAFATGRFSEYLQAQREAIEQRLDAEYDAMRDEDDARA